MPKVHSNGPLSNRRADFDNVPASRRSHGAAPGSRSNEATPAHFERAPAMAPLPDVEALLKKYLKKNAPENVGRPLERVMVATANIDKFLTPGADAADIAEGLVKNDARTPLFRLEALLRLYEDKFGKDAEKALDKVKALEDQLGAVGLANDLLDLAKEHSFPKSAVEHLEARVEEQMGLLTEVVADDWVGKKKGRAPAIADIVEAFAEEEWDSYEDDRAYLCEQFDAHLEEIQNEPLDMNDLQGGVHELRRQLRWMPLFMLATDGAVQLDDQKNPVRELIPLLSDDAVNGPFTRMPAPSREARPIVLSRSLFLANSKAIGDIGDLKDTGEYVEFLGDVLHEVGDAPTLEAARAKAQKLLGRGDAGDVARKAGEIYDNMNRIGLLDATRRDIQNQM